MQFPKAGKDACDNMINGSCRVGPETESVFDDHFWSTLDVVVNALDNIQARLYVDEKCVHFKKPLIDSGTLGAKGNVQVVVPHLTESYGASSDHEFKEIPICTLKFYPYATEHTVQWARDLFEKHFSTLPLAGQKFVKSGGNDNDNTAADLKAVVEFVGSVDASAASLEGCVRWARNLWQIEFRNEIVQLLHHFPPDAKSSTGVPFWLPPKKCPQPLDFDIDDPDHLAFVEAAAHLRAQTLGVDGSLEQSKLLEVLRTVRPQEFRPNSSRIIPEDDTQLPEAEKSESISLQGLNPDTLLSRVKHMRIQQLEFEKDVDENRHIDFIHSAGTLRARNYGIPVTDRSNSKLIAGRIIPALATTTAIVAGLACIELYKIVLDRGKYTIHLGCQIFQIKSYE